MQQHVQGLGDAGSWHGITLDDGFVGLAAARNVVGLDGQDFLQHMRSTECLDSPNLHFSETLTTELCLTTEGLLRDERLRTNGTCVHLVLNHVAQFQHVGDTHGCELVEGLTSGTVIQLR